MKFHHEFTVPLGVEDAWKTLGDIEKLGPYLPGTRLRKGPGDTFTGDTSFAMGPVTVKYTGTGTVTSRDATQRIAVMEAKGVSSDGRKSLRGTVTARLVELGPKQTKVLLDTDVKLGAAAASMGAAKASQMGSQFLGSVSAGLADQLRRRPASTATSEGDYKVTTPPGNLAAGGVRFTKQTPPPAAEPAPEPSSDGTPTPDDDATARAAAARQAATAGARRAKDALRSPQVAGAVGLAAGALATLASRRARG